jgi:hypothetical protein
VSGRNRKQRSDSPSGGSRNADPASSQSERIAQRRESRSRGRQAAAASRRRQKQIQRIALAAVAVIALIGGSVFAYQRITHVEPGEFVRAPSDNSHVPEGTTVTDYSTDPPTSGRHWGSVAPWGVHSEPVPNELQVHNLEHGGIVMQYNCEDCPEIQAELERIAESCSVKLLTAPRPGMEHTIAVTAWERILTMETLDVERINSFIDAYADRGPERLPSESQAWNRCR